VTERTRYRDATSEFRGVVTEVERVGATHVRVVVGGVPQLTLLDTIAVDIGGELRRYSVSRSGADWVEFVAYRTRRGPATVYVDALEVGAPLSGLAPERPVKMPPDDASSVLVVGDDTAVGVARAVGHTHPGRVAVGVLGESLAEDVVSVTGAEVAVFDTDQQLLSWVSERATTPGTHLVLVGEQALNQQVRQHAFALGVDKDRVATRTFWRPDRAGIE
jgi:NADPH-dependent ferric siderophore reductase